MKLLFGLLVLLVACTSEPIQEEPQVKLSSPSYDEALARELLRLSAVSYCDVDKILNWTCGPCQLADKSEQLFNLVVGLTTSGIETNLVITVNESKKRIVFAFEGTHGTTQLIQEITRALGVDYTLHPIPDAVATQYFYNTYIKTLKDPVHQNLKSLKLKYNDFTVAFTGHSLGGALAEHAALDCVKSGLISGTEADEVSFAGPSPVYTFGEPRIGNWYLSQEVEKVLTNYFRITHKRDIVPHIPPCGPTLTSGCYIPEASSINKIFAGYHARTEVFYPGSGSTKVICAEGESSKCSNQNLFNLSVDDHMVYLDESATCA